MSTYFKWTLEISIPPIGYLAIWPTDDAYHSTVSVNGNQVSVGFALRGIEAKRLPAALNNLHFNGKFTKEPNAPV